MSSDFKIVNTEPVPMLSIREKVQNDQIKSKMGAIFGQLWMYMEKNKIQVAGPPYALYHEYDQNGTDMECGWPTIKQEKSEGNIMSSVVPAAKCVMTVHVGPYEQIMATYERMQEHIRKEGLKPKKLMWERYLNDPATVNDPNELITEIYWPIE
jgi:effector-binding domain-containing protein